MKRSDYNCGGFSLVELMVSLVIGLLALSFATRMVVDAERRKDGSVGGSNSMQNGMVAMFSISGDAAQAGWGLNDPLVSGCDAVFSDTGGYALAVVPQVVVATSASTNVRPLTGAVIEANGSAPDRLHFYAGGSISGTGSLRVTTDYTNGTNIDIDRVPYGFSQDDVIVVVPETAGAARCALAQITSNPATLPAPPNPQFLTIATGVRFNSGNLGAAYTGNQARLFNLGQAARLSFHTWSVAGGFLQLRATDLAGASTAASTVIDNIVSIKAQYGLDTRVGAAFDPEAGMQVSQWSNTMIDADADGIAGGPGDYQRVAALRIAVVARNRSPDKPDTSSGLCTTTTTAPTVFATSPVSGAAAVGIALNVAVTNDPIDWKCYRYRAFETIVPMRNSGWRPTA